MNKLDMATQSEHSELADAARPVTPHYENMLHAVQTLLHELVALSHDKPPVRDALRSVGQWLIEQAGGPSSTVAPHGAQHLPAAAGHHGAGTHGAGTHGSAAHSSGQHGASHADDHAAGRQARPPVEVKDEELEVVIQRCQLKAEGARWAVERDDMLQEGADFGTEIRPVDHEIIDQARHLANCFLWMNQPRPDVRRRSEDYLLIADCFDSLADAVGTLRLALSEDCGDVLFLEAINLVAQAQSGLRVAVAQVESHPDADQQCVYQWLRTRAAEQRFYIARYMKVTDPADPEQCDTLIARSEKIRHEIMATVTRGQKTRQLLGQARQHVSRAATHVPQEDEEWACLAQIVDTLIDMGTSPGSPELRTLLTPVLHELPKRSLSPNFDLVVAEIERFQICPVDIEEPAVEAVSEVVAEG